MPPGLERGIPFEIRGKSGVGKNECRQHGDVSSNNTGLTAHF